ncbi:hypothetical protein [Streptomyces sp. SID3343]|uniref:hypothetical protein n=1 Tax=Streptomyces sp. SID3343 TaxID=2690260 RepID=UPI00136A8BE7|nr:hypothetical protein [Streptomyces sp. SID3343]MYV97397.1 hypothetical protein [Streptomyces sp. SID3343]
MRRPLGRPGALVAALLLSCSGALLVACGEERSGASESNTSSQAQGGPQQYSKCRSKITLEQFYRLYEIAPPQGPENIKYCSVDDGEGSTGYMEASIASEHVAAYMDSLHMEPIRTGPGRYRPRGSLQSAIWPLRTGQNYTTSGSAIDGRECLLGYRVFVDRVGPERSTVYTSILCNEDQKLAGPSSRPTDSAD